MKLNHVIIQLPISRIEMKKSHLPTGSSDPVSFTCSCAASKSSGLVLLFYRYFTSNPPLPQTFTQQAQYPEKLADFHILLTRKYSLGGKIRVAKEGFNITVAGTTPDILSYIEECLPHWSFAGLSLDTTTEKDAFFKPTAGCACVFGGTPASVRVTAEITPMGVTNYVPSKWDEIESLSPEEFHARCLEAGDKTLIDVRNYYESRIGYFVDGNGKAATRPEIRRFSQWPLYVRRFMGNNEEASGKEGKGRQILTYCTGGIRCEKGARWMQENMARREGDRVATLNGGIAAYLTWMDKEIKLGRKRPEESLFKGRNYVFDARGSVGLNEDVKVEPVSKCHSCGILSDRLSKCRSRECHLVLVVCAKCEEDAPLCCSSCSEWDIQQSMEVQTQKPRPICECERDRETRLWKDGAADVRISKPRTKKGLIKSGPYQDVEIRVKIID